jgi:hypothetical protein
MPYLKFKRWFSGNQAEGPIQQGEIRNFSAERSRQILQTDKAVLCDSEGNEQRPPHEGEPVETTSKEDTEKETEQKEQEDAEQRKDKASKKPGKRKTK